MNGKIRNAALAALFVVLAGPAAASAQIYQPDPRQQPDSRDYDQDYPNDYGDSDFRQTVARLSYISGNVAFSRGDEPDEWQPADRNVPMTMGDRVWTANGRLELQIQGGNVVRMAKRTSLVALSLTEDTSQFSLTSGIASFKIGRLDEYEVFEVDTPNAAITFETPGDYRIDVREGYTRVQVRRGQASVASGGGQVPLGGGDALLLEGYDTPRYEFVPARSDGWDGWVQGREAQYSRVRSYEYVSPSIAGVEDLDRYGRWQSLPTYGWSWTPSSVAVGWAPYRAGRWMWQDPWGWTWVSTEQWGWAPYHYGRWVTHQSSWFWVPGQRAAYVPYRPALVAFVGGAGPGFSVSVGVGSGYIGWFPLAPREPLIPWWGRPSVNVNVTNVTNITYINRTYTTVVNEQTFVGGQSVATNYVRDRAIVNRVEREAVLRGPIPIYPTRASLRASTRTTTAPRPPAAVSSRPVVARLAPPPAPPRFAEKSAVIRQNRGAPVNPVEAHRMAEKRDQLKPPVAVRPVAREAGRVELAPKSQTARTVQAQPVTAPRGRQLATRERPVASEPVPKTERRRQAPAAAPAPAPAQERDIRERTAPTPVGREREAAQERENQQQQQQREVQQREAAQQQQREVEQREVQERQKQQRETAQRETAQQQQREAEQREVQERQKQQRETAQRETAQQQQREAEQREVQERQKQQRETAQRESKQREAAQQQQREAEQREVQERQKQQRETAQRETAQREAQQEAARERAAAPKQEATTRRAPAPTAVPSERTQPAPQVRERPPSSERVSPQPRAERPQNPPAEPETTPSRQRGRVTPKPTAIPRG